MRLNTSRREFSAMLKLAVPVALAELGWVGMSIVDTIMVGRLGPEAIGAVSVGSSLLIAVAIFGIGLLLGMDTLVSQAFGAGQQLECRKWLLNGTYLALALGPLLAVVALAPLPFLDDFGTQPDVLRLTIPYLEILSLSILPLMLYTAFRRYLQSLSRVNEIMFALVSANVVNAIVNWLLIFGNLGAPKLGVTGAGWATLASRIYLAGVLLTFILSRERHEMAQLFRQYAKPEIARIRKLISLGFPAAMHVTLEVSVFAMATALASKLDAVSLASHQIVLATASFTFMVPLGVSAAAAVRVGQALGRLDRHRALQSGWTAIYIGAGFMTLSGITLYLYPFQILGIYTSDTRVLEASLSILVIAAVFQIFDGIQVVSTGALRGLGETKIPMFTSLLCYWFLALPIAWVLCFNVGWGVFGLWIGLATGLITIAGCLLAAWTYRIRRYSHEDAPWKAAAE